ncbi:MULTISPECIES: SpoIIIAH-like family protein [Bacillus]|uniref:Stage III sporulation protein AH n=2 Tax=Bacillus cereus group TaxID=86661 RepID=A0A9X7BRH2_BACTU|nr:MULTISPECIES: SpoIIIAH-like family protein [Bacillus]MBJ9979704.1 SpoIIIAH-like family protein [Bacillus sp. S29]MBK0100882.1 SpoIIIAH-like family protein [Bacillus sp. S70]MBK0105500.1 SpoIIIAH-like family protein [Bacillus sp. S73]MBK0134331.1 SpoIIIAH-like family protein [Bacillus sp. S72]MBK0149845.1 SpoIIIAH-like family protein [Bacillus sp. S74]MBK0157441.1 SpoIIIAH-like family protein [Bacillus sp. S71]MCI4248497.1 SpoIIIAH-like family protein [Bacillus sp. CCB-MMP212]PAW39702.1 s
MLKKQTVWLLTMLSLVVVLSVYYVTTPDKMNTASPATGEKIGQEKQGTDKAVTNEAPKETPKKENTSKETTNKETDKKENAKKETSKKEGNVSVQSSDENFTALRMQMEDQRSEAKAKLQEVMSSTKASATEKNKAKENFDAITTMETKQELLETVIKSQGGYPDALVRADGTDIRVTVKAAKHSQKEANKIIQLVRSEGGSKDVGVKFDPPAK